MHRIRLGGSWARLFHGLSHPTGVTPTVIDAPEGRAHFWRLALVLIGKPGEGMSIVRSEKRREMLAEGNSNVDSELADHHQENCGGERLWEFGYSIGGGQAKERNQLPRCSGIDNDHVQVGRQGQENISRKE